MKVTRIAATMALGNTEWFTRTDEWMDYEADDDAEHIIEFAGRACYQSFEKPNPATAANSDYITKNLIGKQHYSVLEHSSATFYVQGVSRNLTHELVRHRHLSFSQLSQRYVDSADSGIVVPPLFEDDTEIAGRLAVWHEVATALYDELVSIATTRGASRKQAREAARAVLPGGTETSIVVTGNFRAWREFLAKRHSVAADAEIQRLAAAVLIHLRELAPSVFADIPEEPFS